MPRFSIFHNNFLTSSEILSWWNPVTFADGSSWSTRWARTTASQQFTKCHAGPWWQKHSVCWIFQSFCANFIGAYSVFLCGTHLLLEAATATTCFYKKTTDKCVHHHVKQTLAVHKHTRYTTMTPTSLWISSQRRSVVGSRASRLWEPVSGSVCRLDRASWHCDWM